MSSAPESREPVVRLRGVSKRYGSLTAVSNLDLEVHAAEVMALLGYQALTASNGIEALSMAQQEQPDLILMDVWLPLKNGTAAAREIRALDAFCDM